MRAIYLELRSSSAEECLLIKQGSQVELHVDILYDDNDNLLSCTNNVHTQ